MPLTVQLLGLSVYVLSMVIETAAGGLNLAAPILAVMLIDVAFVRGGSFALVLTNAATFASRCGFLVLPHPFRRQGPGECGVFDHVRPNRLRLC